MGWFIPGRDDDSCKCVRDRTWRYCRGLRYPGRIRLYVLCRLILLKMLVFIGIYGAKCGDPGESNEVNRGLVLSLRDIDNP